MGPIIDQKYIFDGRVHLLPSSFNYTKNMKQIVTDLIQEDKAPEEAFFVCNLGELIQKHYEWLSAMPRVKPFYAVKCNDNALVLETLAGLGTGFDCASKAEMKKIIDLGVNPSDIIFANPAKQASHIRTAAEFEIKTMTFDNEFELHKIKRIFPDARLVIRIRCDADKAQCQLGMKFGVLVEEAQPLLAIAKELELNVVGVSFHVGSGCMDPPVFRRAIASANWIFNIAKDFGFSMNLLDIGGGFPGNTGTSISEIGTVVNGALDKYFPEGCGVTIIAEPGRFYVASAFTLVTQVHSMKEVKDGPDDKSYMYYINDGVYGSFNCVLYDHAVVRPDPIKDANNELFFSSIWGPTCDGLDQVCSSVKLPRMTLGDRIMFSDMGAYTIVAAGTFNGFPIPKIYYVATKEICAMLRKILVGSVFEVTEKVDVYMKKSVGCNRDAVGWGAVNVNFGDMFNKKADNMPEIPQEGLPVEEVKPPKMARLIPQGPFFELAENVQA